MAGFNRSPYLLDSAEVGDSVIITGSTPILGLYENDADDPQGRWRFDVSSDVVNLERAGAAGPDFSTVLARFSFHESPARFTFHTGDDGDAMLAFSYNSGGNIAATDKAAGLRVDDGGVAVSADAAITYGNYFGIPSYATSAAGSARTVDLAATVYIAGPPTNILQVTLTEAHAFMVASGSSRFDGAITMSYENSGGTNTLTVANTAAAAGSDARIDLGATGAGGGDAWISFVASTMPANSYSIGSRQGSNNLFIVHSNDINDAQISVQLDPTGGMTVTGDINPEADGTRNLGTQTTAQWANVWADAVQGQDFCYANGWRTLELEKYHGYPVGLAIGNEGFKDGEVTERMEPGLEPVFAVGPEFIEYRGRRLTARMLDRFIAAFGG